ncbi:hypothetical protein SLEP1_g59860 [Rubroshorea leprosula]|uniref:Uncharacterized protein n=1 Tax=Rubroshorea leprosula TaxID=152421 RepID=A0AAV5MY57_9ROSI|nr:hypothetical protein SLEP1_g59860 [Rubroshorea leprosula]
MRLLRCPANTNAIRAQKNNGLKRHSAIYGLYGPRPYACEA